ncbi:MAG: acetyl-CoA carboxylase, carboxyltransferase subunit beta [Candidatus Omnitrophica bacterium]|jgi:acetyl-CoA carboxylase carboxyl transferase subunit beta|nr:acetyl-CoA carboxylase, carboxyltransferase subunit beta [Candidatus Omnitrophota bacterium]MDD3987528.1 acetyl-CoA carboxylase, carboxyltransferase subunit beta [Candidatus Omnitrophota bacterium]MDD4981979.1 acetyl-CoA carboxylase, carboxyltransferase subunit beta [Candidatus Omnitrophota bacterium]MDD5665399.1 acetyl-CoA carboxylase, carboxyltransferase subunit beta [Candidatus Omnitrophota bacterium]
MALFGRPKYTIVRLKKKEIPDGLWTKCEACSETLYNKTIEENLKVCPKCGHHFSLGAYERIRMLVDKDTFEEYDKDMLSADPLDFKGPKTYKDKIAADQKVTGLNDAVVSGQGQLNGRKLIIAVTDSRFIMGSMGSVVGEKITRAIENAIEKKLPLVIVSGSGGGARMYEGMLSLMQMSKTCAALSYLRKARLPYISILTNPTMGGVMASFAGVGDIIMAEPKALIGFAGPRVIEQTIRQKLPAGFQRSEFLLDHGLIDMIVPRKNMKDSVSKLLDYLS